MASRQYTLRGLVAFTGIIGVTCGLAALGDTSSVEGIILIAIAARILALVLVAAIVGILVNSIAKAFVAALIGVLLADLAWLSFLFAFFAIGPKDAMDVVANPVLPLALLTCPAAAAQNRMHALTMGISLSIVVPTVIAAPIVLMCAMSGGSGTGLAAALSVIIAAMAIATGVVGTIAARVSFELIAHLVNKWHGARHHVLVGGHN